MLDGSLVKVQFLFLHCIFGISAHHFVALRSTRNAPYNTISIGDQNILLNQGVGSNQPQSLYFTQQIQPYVTPQDWKTTTWDSSDSSVEVDGVTSVYHSIQKDYFSNKLKQIDSDEIDDIEEEKEKKRKKALAIGLGVTFGLLGLIVILAGLYYCVYYRNRRRRVTAKQPKKLWHVSNHAVSNDYRSQKQIAKRSISTDPWIIDSDSFTVDYENKLGSGAFCAVFKGRVIGEPPVCRQNPSIMGVKKFKDCECAVKVLPEFADSTARYNFMQEISFMKTLQYHLHLVSMIGWNNDSDSPMLLVEYCKQGDLQHLLRSKKDEIIQGFENKDSLKIRDLVSFSWQVSNGMEYLSSIGCIHRDIAARNVLIDENNVAKVSDFGLCRIPDEDLYNGKGGRLPLKWMAPESLISYTYSEKSDVWSYGVLLYEIFSFGSVPYTTEAMTSAELQEFLKSGKRLQRTPYCPEEIYELMQLCWKFEQEERPTFVEVSSTLTKILESSSQNYGYVDAVNEYDESVRRPNCVPNDENND